MPVVRLAGRYSGEPLRAHRHVMTEIMERPERGEQDARFVGAMIDRRRLPIEAEELTDGSLRRAHGIFDSEDDVIGQLAILPDEAQGSSIL